MHVDEIRTALDHAATGQGFLFHTYGQVNPHPLNALTRDAGEEQPHIYLSSGIHGDEPAGVLALLEPVSYTHLTLPTKA